MTDRTERAVPRPRTSLLEQPPTPLTELDLQDLELCGEVGEMTRSIEVPADLLAQMRAELSETLGSMAPPSEAEIEDRTIAMFVGGDRRSSAPLAFAATQELPSLPPEPMTMAPPPRGTRAIHVFLAVMLGLLVSGGEVFAATSIPHVVARVTGR